MMCWCVTPENDAALYVYDTTEAGFRVQLTKIVEEKAKMSILEGTNEETLRILSALINH